MRRTDGYERKESGSTSCSTRTLRIQTDIRVRDSPSTRSSSERVIRYLGEEEGKEREKVSSSRDLEAEGRKKVRPPCSFPLPLNILRREEDVDLTSADRLVAALSAEEKKGMKRALSKGIQGTKKRVANERSW